VIGHIRRHGTIAIVAGMACMAGCATQPRTEFVVATPPGVEDARSRFSGYFCAVIDRDQEALPDYRPCNEALGNVAAQTAAATLVPELGESKAGLTAVVVPGIGYSCIAEWLKPDDSMRDHLRRSGFKFRIIEVDALSGTGTNARQIRDQIMAMPEEPAGARLVLIGYSKGAPDILDAIVSYPEMRSRITAVVSLAGAVGGSPLADDADERAAQLFRHFPGAECDGGDRHAVEALRPDVRKRWLAEHPLPADMRYYSVVTLPDPDRVSGILKPSYRKLRKLDARNDGQVIAADQILPTGKLLAYLNADHWAVALPISRSHPIVGTLLVTDNDYPREALFEAILRFIEDDIAD
jgi:hypothetical protein